MKCFTIVRHRLSAAPLATRAFCALVAASVVFVLPAPVSAGSPDHWEARILPTGLAGVSWHGTVIGALPGTTDGYDGEGSPSPVPPQVRVFALVYHENGPSWTGPTAFYAEDYRSPIAPGGSKTWWDFYLWAQNWTLDPPGQVQVRTTYETAYDRPPDGYVGQLVLDYVPPECNWTGPTEFWLDLTRQNNIATLPAATVTDPLQSTRFHLTVYAIPEPSGPLALGACLAALAGVAVKLRKS